MKTGVDYTGIGVCAAIINKEGKILLAKRGKKARNERGKWEFPGGSVEFGDTMKTSVIREVQEELGVEIKPSKLLPAVDHLLPDEGQHWVAHAFLAKIVNGKPAIKEPEKCDEIGWFSFNEMKRMDITIALTTYLPILEKYLPRKVKLLT